MRTRRDINKALRVYLGSDSGAYDPLGDHNERLRRAYPEDHQAMREAIEPYLAFTLDWTEDSLQNGAKLFTKTIQKRFPELDAISARSLANRFTFDWK